MVTYGPRCGYRDEAILNDVSRVTNDESHETNGVRDF